MKYEFKIEGSEEPKGAIDLQRIAFIAESIRKISEGALQIRLKGISIQKGRKMISLEKALKVSLTGIKEGSTVLCLESQPFSETLEQIQLDLFRQEAQIEIPKHTPVSMFITAFHDALDEESNKEYLDKPLLKELKNFKRAFFSDKEKVSISNQGSLSQLELTKSTFTRIKSIDDELPKPESIVLNGKVDLLHFSKFKVQIMTQEGIVNGTMGDDLDPDEIARYWGKEVTLTGTQHYKPGGKNIVEIQRVFEPEAGDEYFSRKKKTETVEQQIQRQLRVHNYQNLLPEIVGKWPGDEEFDDLLKMLTK
jgi:hypothetical protein